MKNLFALLVAAMFAILSGTAHADKPDWQQHLDWSIGNSTGPDHVNCPEQYVATEAAALTSGGRAALMRSAINAAKANNQDYAMRLALIGQCHNSGAQTQIAQAGKAAVTAYLAAR